MILSSSVSFFDFLLFAWDFLLLCVVVVDDETDEAGGGARGRSEVQSRVSVVQGVLFCSSLFAHGIFI